MKNKGIWKVLVIEAILLAIFQLIAFVIPSPFTAVFWIAYGFTMTAFLTVLYVWFRFFAVEERLYSKLFRLPACYVGTIYLGIQVIVFCVFKICFFLPVWLDIVVNALLCLAGLLGVVLVGTGNDQVILQNEKIREKSEYLRILYAKVIVLSKRTEDQEIKQQLGHLAEKIRFSEVMSPGYVSEEETALMMIVSDMEKEHGNKLSDMISEADLLLEKRNRKIV